LFESTLTASEVAKEFGQYALAITKRAVRGESVMVDLGLDLESII
jgi:hypothetical protein